jgi:hypothetical protein
MEGLPAHTWDEAGRYSSKNSLTAFNKDMDEAIDTLRIHNASIMIVRHDISRVPKELIEHEIIGLLIRCKKRIPGSGYTSAEVYDFQSVTHLIKEIKQATAPQYVFNKIVYPNFHFRFKDLSPERSEQLRRLSTTKKLDMWQQKDIQTQGLITLTELKTITNMSDAWIRNKIKELKIKEEMIHKKKKYYPQDTIQKLKRQR